jgi:Mn-dependent DtxR family transcriptional regulator
MKETIAKLKELPFKTVHEELRSFLVTCIFRKTAMSGERSHELADDILKELFELINKPEKPKYKTIALFVDGELLLDIKE